MSRDYTRNRRRAAGVCTLCGVAPPEPARTNCQPCATRKSATTRAQYAARRRAGMEARARMLAAAGLAGGVPAEVTRCRCGAPLLPHEVRGHVCEGPLRAEDYGGRRGSAGWAG